MSEGRDTIGKDTLRFANEHVEPVLAGEKTVTARYDFEREYEWGYLIRFVDEDDRPFAVGAVRRFEEMTVDEFAAADIDGHRSYDETGELLDELAAYYPEASLHGNSVLTVIGFDPIRELFICGYCGKEFQPLLSNTEPRCPRCRSTKTVTEA